MKQFNLNKKDPVIIITAKPEPISHGQGQRLYTPLLTWCLPPPFEVETRESPSSECEGAKLREAHTTSM